MAVFPDSLRKVFVGAGSIRTTGSSSDLKPGELGLFDAETFKAVAIGATYTSNPKVVLAQGSFHQKDVLALGHGGLKESIKSRPIHGAHITEWRLAHPSRPQPHIVTIGYDGVDTTKTLAVEKDKTYTLRLVVKGDPVSRFINHDLYHDFMYTTECSDDCTDNCSDPTSAAPLAESIAKDVNEHPYISPFVKAEVLYSALASYPSTAHDLYQLTIADDGSVDTLAEVQRQFPTRNVVRVSRTGIMSTYEICIPTSDGAPASFTNAGLRVIPDCTTCPSGYTSVGKLYKFEVKRQDAGSAGNLTTVTSDYSSSPAATRVSYEYGTSTYIIYKSTASVPAAVAATDVVVQAGFLDAVCTLTTPTTTAWVDAGDRYKTTRTLTLTLAKTCGGANRLTELQAFYVNEPTRASAISVQTAGDCGDVYTVTQYNNECLLNPCESHDNPTFSNFQSFEGNTWEATDVTFGGDGASVGIRFTSAFVETKFGQCSFDPFDHYNLEIPKIFVSQVLTEDVDRCDTYWDVTELQQPKFASGTGEYVKRELIEFMRYRQEEFFTPAGSRFNETQDINSWADRIDVSKYYKIYYLVYNVPYTNRRTNLFDNEEYELMIVFPEQADTRNFESLINGYVTSVGVQLKAL